MFRSHKSTIRLALTLALVLALVAVEPALAADSSGIGSNVGNEVTSWAKGLLLGTAALVGLPALARRDVGQGMVIVILTVLIGGFVFANQQVESVMSTFWKTIAGQSDTSTSTSSGANNCGGTPQEKC